MLLTMNYVTLFGRRVLNPIVISRFVLRAFCNCSVDSGGGNGGNRNNIISDGYNPIERLVREYWESCNCIGNEDDGDERRSQGSCDLKVHFFETTERDADRLFDVLQQDGPECNVRLALTRMNVRVSGLLVRQVFMKILKNMNCENKPTYARLAYKFFIWSSEDKYYMHTLNAYHLLMKIFVKAEEFKAMWRLVDEMTEKGYPITATTFNILMCSCKELGLKRLVVERFIMSKEFNYRPFKHSYNAILVALLRLNQYKLVRWVYQQMLADGILPDTLAYNVLIYARYRLGKMDSVHRLLDEMSRKELSPDFYTYNILLHVLGKGDKPYAALNLLNHMKEVGISPTSLHFTSLIDGLSRAGNMDASKYFFDEMSKNGFKHDVVSYTVLINGYVAARELEKAQQLFEEMIADGQLPNVFTYNSIIRGLCMAGKFKDACSMLKEMESKGCSPNFLVYNTLICNLRKNGKLSEAHKILKDMIEKGLYVHRISRYRRYQKG